MTQQARKNFIVTGAARGIGAAAVAQLAGRAANVLAVDIDGEGLAEVVTQLKDELGLLSPPAIRP
jgi:NAD(P)-dependent dehydrogenase (short-subunit alcohol dehydrogenase family)